MKILTIANKKEEKFLRTKTADFDFSKVNKTRLNQVIKEMRKTMTLARGIGLSANQVGLNLKFFVVQISDELLKRNENNKIILPPSEKMKFYAIFNPKIKTPLLRNKKIEMEEGCLSVPGVYGMVKRYGKITLIGQDINSKKIKIKAEGLLARVFQHETDHLNGILFIDKCKKIYKITNI
ncbi:MAG: peptide deformylase [Patescibacteria group bacterium]